MGTCDSIDNNKLNYNKPNIFLFKKYYPVGKGGYGRVRY
jgi:hypothetical protein